ncbi:MAG TPA: Smr/MutS family protein [Usitatibacter sp.]|nr:Smr/MutS family protein [Usitatibacter sp.]
MRKTSVRVTARRRDSTHQAPQPPDEGAAFREAVRDVRPLPPVNRIEPTAPKAKPVPVKRIEDERAVLQELAHLAMFDLDDVEIDDDGLFLRPGLPRDILRKLRRQHWSIQGTLDLHGLNSEEAALALATFLAEARAHGLRCVRVIHGKGLRSPGREPVLKKRVRRMLMRRDDVLAFAEPPAAGGGGGAVVVLLDV